MPPDALRFDERGANQPQRQTATMRRKRRRPNPAASRAAKKRYRQNKQKYRQALKKFHRSARGKQFHRKLGRLRSRMNASAALDQHLLTEFQLDLSAYIEELDSYDPLFDELLDIVDDFDVKEDQDLVNHLFTYQDEDMSDNTSDVSEAGLTHYFHRPPACGDRNYPEPQQAVASPDDGETRTPQEWLELMIHDMLSGIAPGTIIRNYLDHLDLQGKGQ